MLDVRQGPLPIWADPLSTAAERVAGARAMTPAELEHFVTAADNWPHPHNIGYRGFIPSPGWPRSYYQADDGNWFDTETGEAWNH